MRNITSLRQASCMECTRRVPVLHLLIVGSVLICPLVDALQGLFVKPSRHTWRAWQRPTGLGAHSMLQDLGQVLCCEVPEQVAALEQLIADVHGMVAYLHSSKSHTLPSHQSLPSGP